MFYDKKIVSFQVFILFVIIEMFRLFPYYMFFMFSAFKKLLSFDFIAVFLVPFFSNDL